MNRQVKQRQENLDDNNKRLESIPHGKESDENSADPSDSTKGKKDKKQKFRNELDARGSDKKSIASVLKTNQRKKSSEYFKEETLKLSDITSR